MIATLTTATFRTPNGEWIYLMCRPETIDYNVSYGILTRDEYGLRGHHFSGWMLDIGGYIGAVGIAMAVENPDLRVAIVEPIAENCEVIAENIRRNDVGERVQLIAAAASIDEPQEILYRYQHVDTEPDGYVQASRYVGNIYAKDSHPMVAETCTVPGRSLSSLIDEIGADRIALAKLDCEGCEWTVLRDRSTERVDTFIGEWHAEPGLEGLRELLPLHDVRQIDTNPINGIFWAERR